MKKVLRVNKKIFIPMLLTLAAIVIIVLALRFNGGGQYAHDACIEEENRIAAYKTTQTHDAYIWQRVWTPALADAVREAAPAIKQWRVLAAQASSDTQLKRFEPDWRVLAESGRPVVLVVRIDGQLHNFDQQAMLGQIGMLYIHWQERSAQHGITLTGIEIDYDCATRRLSVYADFLQRLRAHLLTLSQKTLPQDQSVQLSITALPDWLNAQELDLVLANVDHSVLQVHSVADPAQGGLFNTHAAKDWVQAYHKRCAENNKPFLMALPNYGSRVNWDRKGRIATVTSEAPVRGGVDIQGHSQELSADPQEISSFLLQAFDYQALPQLKGVAWFRLPTAQDERVWAISTWLAVIRGESLRADVQALLTPSSEDSEFYRVMLQNNGSADAVQPARINLPTTCVYADGVQANGYTLQQEAYSQGDSQGNSGGDQRFFQRQDQGLLRARQSKEIGWARCEVGVEGRLEVQ